MGVGVGMAGSTQQVFCYWWAVQFKEQLFTKPSVLWKPEQNLSTGIEHILNMCALT